MTRVVARESSINRCKLVTDTIQNLCHSQWRIVKFSNVRFPLSNATFTPTFHMETHFLRQIASSLCLNHAKVKIRTTMKYRSSFFPRNVNSRVCMCTFVWASSSETIYLCHEKRVLYCWLSHKCFESEWLIYWHNSLNIVLVCACSIRLINSWESKRLKTRINSWSLRDLYIFEIIPLQREKTYQSYRI